MAFKEALHGGIICDYLQLPVDGSTTIGSSASTLQPISLDDPAKSHMQVAIRGIYRIDRDPKSTLCVPLVLRSSQGCQSVGVIEVYDMPRGATSESSSQAALRLRDVGARWLPMLHGHALQLQAIRAEETSNRLRQIAQELALCDSRDSVVHAIESLTYELLKPQRVTLFLVDSNAKKLTIALSMDATGLSLPLSTGSIAGSVARTGAAVNLPDAYDDPRFSRSVDEKTGFRTKSMLCVPINGAQGNVIAVLQAINRTVPAPASTPRSLMPLALALAPNQDADEDGGRPRQGLMAPSPLAAESSPTGAGPLQRQTSNDGIYSFSGGDLDVVLSMAAHAGISFSKAQHLDDAERARDRSRALLQVVRAVAAKVDIPSLLNTIVEAAESVVRAKRVSLFLVDQPKEQLWAIVSQDIAGARIPLGKGIAGLVARTGKKLNVPDAQHSVHFNEAVDSDTGFSTRQVLCMPVQMSGHREVIAVLQCVNTATGHPFDEDDESSLEIFCAEVANALQRRSMDAQLYKVMRDSKAKDAGGMHRQSTSETDFQSSVLDFYSNGNTSVRLHASHSSARLSFRNPGASNSLSAMSSSRRAELLPPKDPLLQWDFNVFSTSDDEKYLNFARMLNHYALPQRLRVQQDTLARFTRAVRSKYRDENPFHNWNHGWDVMHTTFMLLHHTPADSVLEWLEILAVLTAALCHDIDHPGHSQSYEINTFSPLALQHSDSAVLERHHAHTTFRVLLETNAEGEQHHNIFAALPVADFKRVRKVIIAAIMATDMGKHFHMVTALNARAIEAEQRGQRLDAVLQTPRARPSTGSPKKQHHRVSRSLSHAEMDSLSFRHQSMDRSRQHSSPSMDRQLVAFDAGSEADRLQLIEALVHTADLGGQAYAPEVSELWASRVVAEFQAQAAKESAAKLPVAPFMACLGTPLAAHKTQLSFVDNVMAPLWTSLAALLPGLNTPLANIRANRAHYAVQIERLQGGEVPQPPLSTEGLTPASSTYSVAEPIMTMDDLTITTAISEASVEDASPTHRSPVHSEAGGAAAGSLGSKASDLDVGDDGVDEEV